MFYRRKPVTKTRSAIVNITLSLIAVIFTLMAIEFYFKVFFAQSDAYYFTLASENWKARYWYPINSFGYRDREWSPEDMTGKHKIMVVGDSLVAGSGISNYQDRFSNKLNDLLGNEYSVFTVASPGWNTSKEIEAIINYPYKPDTLIFTYFINDVEGSAYRQGVKPPRFVKDPPPILAPLVQNSYTLNFVYWRWARLGQQEGQRDYLKWVSEISSNPEIWWVHQQELQTIHDGAKSEGINLIVVVFPNISTIDESQQIIMPVLDFFQSRGVVTLNVTDLIQDKAPDDLMASPVDSHPNEIVHREVAEHLYQMIQAEKATSNP